MTGDRTTAGVRVFRGAWVALAVLMFAVLFLVRMLLDLIWPDRDGGRLDLVLFPTMFTVGWVLLQRSWLRVSADGLRAGHGPFTRARVPVGDVVRAGTYRVRPRRSERERRTGDVELYGGWGPRVLLERDDGSRVVVGVTDPEGALAALRDAGVPVGAGGSDGVGAGDGPGWPPAAGT